MSENSDSQILRRNVVKGAAGVGLTVLGAGVLATGGCGLTGDRPTEEKKPLITTGIINLGAPANYPAGTVSNKFLSMYGIAISNDSGTITVIRPVCTHKGCVAVWHWDKNLFICPCHGSNFDIEGQPVKGPAKKNLARVPVIENADGTLSVDLDKLYRMVPPTPKA
jgi:cytochrome b6-f complex iron-sulfur subunit